MKTTLKWTLALAGLAICALVIVLAAFTWQAGRRKVRNAADAAPAGGRFLKAGDVEVFVQEAGSADGPAALFIHGTGAWSEAWRGTMAMLAKQGVRAIALDLPPFGFSQRPADASYGKRDQGRRIVAVLDALQVPSAVLVGHSFGSGPTVEAAILAPDRVRALVLVDAFLTNPMFTRRLLQGFIDDPARATDAWVAVYQQPLGVKDTTAALGAWLPALIGPSTGAASENPAAYKALRMPVYVIWGERDSITPLAQGERLTRLIPGAELAVMKAVGHIPQIEIATAFNELLGKIIAKALSASGKP